jgi:hypothetical protein
MRITKAGYYINPLNAKLNLICHLLALLGARHILHVSRIRVKKRGLIQVFMAGVSQMTVFLVLTLYRINFTDISEEHVASIFRVAEFGSSCC